MYFLFKPTDNSIDNVASKKPQIHVEMSDIPTALLTLHGIPVPKLRKRS